MAYFRNLGEATDLSEDEYEENDMFMNEDAQYDDGPGISDTTALMEAIIVDEVSRMSDDERMSFLNSETFADLQEAGAASKRSVIRMSKMSDLKRRIDLAALQKAKEAGDADWEALRKNRIRERKLRERIFKKYGARVKMDAMKAQKKLVQINPQVFNTLRAVR